MDFRPFASPVKSCLLGLVIALCVGFVACDDDDDAAGVSIAPSAPPTASPCEVVTLTSGITGQPANVRWEVQGLPVLHVEIAADNATASFRAPVSNQDIDLNLVLVATKADGSELRDGVAITVAAAPDDPALAEGMAPGCGPFPYGVTSGDPLPRSVLLWTAVEAPLGGGDGLLSYVVATDPHLRDVVSQGQVAATAIMDYTAMVDVTGLSPDTTYYYRFTAENGESSVMGRTKTAPEGSADRVRLLTMSCSSVYSGYFNSYARIAEVEDVDVAIHLGDYLYDFVDPEERVRIPPGPEPVDPSTKSEWQQRFTYYLSDPDFRRARQAHPWIALWDNHDPYIVEANNPSAPQLADMIFRQYVPSRQPDPNDPAILYRTLSFGNLVDIIIGDQQYARLSNTPDETKFGDVQWAWLNQTISDSDAAWRVFGTQKLGIALNIPFVSSIGASGFEDEPQTRSDLYALFGQKGDNLFLSGDLHFAVVADMVDDPTSYDPATGVGSVGGELLAASINRGNFDETICGGDPCDAASLLLIQNIGIILGQENPHIVYTELTEHGFGVVDVTPERIEAEVRFSKIRQLESDYSLISPTFVMERGANRWTR